jgi:hypothetical protein
MDRRAAQGLAARLADSQFALDDRGRRRIALDLGPELANEDLEVLGVSPCAGSQTAGRSAMGYRMASKMD